MRVHDARFVAAADNAEALPAPAFAEIAFAGRSNVGKSSLINRMVGRRKLVRTSGTPGCTRALNLFRVELVGEQQGASAVLDLVDLPGFGYAKRSKSERRAWGPMVETFLQTRVGLRAVLLIVDVRRGIEEEEAQLLEFLRDIDRSAILVATKLDKLAANQRPPRLASLKRDTGVPVYGTSAVKGLGIDPLWRAVLNACAISLPTAP